MTAAERRKQRSSKLEARRRRRSERRGRRGEALAALWLRLKGYAIVACRARTSAGEIDIVARKGAVLVFVEVKTRAHWRDGLHAVSASAQRRLARAGQAWLAAHVPQNGRGPVRFDVIIVSRDALPRHVRDAWRPDAAL